VSLHYTWFCSGWALLVGLFWGLGLKCDDSCSSIGGWRHDPDAWQWNALAALGALAFVSGGAFFVFVWRRKPAYAAATLAVGFAAVLLLSNALSSDWIEHFDRRTPGQLLLMAAGVFAPILAVLLTVPEVMRRRER
jgi:uncharacterized membrane protein HdeD (DUF308 family)